MNLLDAKRKLLPLSGYMGMGGGGGGTQQSTNTTYQTNIPEYAKPYVETMLGATQKQLFQGTPTAATYDEEGKELTPAGFDITGFQPYRSYGGTYDAQGNQTSYDPGKSIAGFQPMQTQAQQGIANMQTPEQYGQAMGITGQGIMGQLGTAGQGVGLSGMGYQAADAGNQYAQQATNPYAMQAYMSPYMQNVVDIQQREAQRQGDIASTGRNAQAVQAGAFGGSRQAVMDAEAARNLATQKGDIQAQGLQSAFQQAQQAQQYGAGLGLQGMQAGMQGVGAGIGAQQAGYGQAMSGAQNLANLGQQQLAAQQGIYSLQNTTGAQQQALEQQKVNQAIQDYSNAQQYPLMQLGTMSNMIRGLPMQAQTTQQYVAAPNPITQAIGAAGAGASLYNAFKGAEGGIIKGYAKGGIMSYDVGGEVESDLYNMDESSLQKQLKESSSPSIKRMAQRILRERQLEKQPQQPRLAGGGIIAFNTGNEVKEPPTSSEILHQRVMQGKPTGDVMAQPQGIVQAPAVPPPAPKAPLTALEAVQADPEVPNAFKGILADTQTRAARSISDIRKEKQAEYEAAGVAQRDPEVRANLMKERANAEDEARRNRYLQAAAFFARWGSTPGETLAAGLIAVRERIPEIVEGEKEAKKVRMEINKSIASLDEATRLETIGEIDAAAAVKEKDAEKMQVLYLKLSEYQMQTQKDAAAQKRLETREDAALERMEIQEELKGKRMQTLQDSVNATTLAGDRIRADATRASRAGQEATDMVGRVTAAAQLQANVEKIIETEMSKPAYAMLVNRAGMAETPDTLPLIKAAKEQLAIRERNFNTMRKNAQDTVDFVREKAGMKPPVTPSGNAPPPPPGAKVD